MEHIESVYGKTYGHIGMEVQNALKQYVENYQKDDIQDVEDRYQRKMEEMRDKCKSKIKALEMENNALQGVQDSYDQLHEEYFKLQNQNNKLRNNYDHLQERLNKSQRELNMLERENSDLRVVVAKIEKMSFLERVLNRLPSEMKELTSGKEDLK